MGGGGGGLTDETRDVPMTIDEYSETVEDKDYGEEDEGCPSGIWLERRFIPQTIAVDSLGLEGLVELRICETDHAPIKQRRNSSQIL